MERASGEYRMDIGMRLLCVTVVLGAGGTSGCWHFCSSLAKAGITYERPVKVTEAYGDRSGRRLCIRYVTEMRDGNGDKCGKLWTNLDGQLLAEALHRGFGTGTEDWLWRIRRDQAEDRDLRKVLRIPEACEAYCLRSTTPPTRRPQWKLKSMMKLDVYEHKTEDDLSVDGTRLGTSQMYPNWSGANLTYAAMNVPELGVVLVINCPPDRRYRTAGGYAAQGLMPFAFVLDVLTSPLQLLGDYAMAINGGPNLH
jgi:hypothetical protein